MTYNEVITEIQKFSLDEQLRLFQYLKEILGDNIDDDIDLDDTPIEEIKESLTRAFQEVKTGKTRPISELWERIENE
ncbi:MAG TPA: hypothetical protein VK203_00300 [Nostocaceae cyanobacterium]|nr:hypothetical protein [Nostocaceae cyanobacterium]